MTTRKLMLATAAVVLTTVSAHAQSMQPGGWYSLMPPELAAKARAATAQQKQIDEANRQMFAEAAKARAKALAEIGAQRQIEEEANRAAEQARTHPASGNGCGGMGVVAIAEMEKAATNAVTQPTSTTIGASFRQQLQPRLAELTEQYKADPTKDLADLVMPPAAAADKIDDKMLRECAPNFLKMIETIKTKADAEHNAAVAAQANAQRPDNKLFEAYWRFVVVEYCHKVREDYAVIYISDPELARAQAVVKAVKKDALAADPSLNTDAIWDRALGYPKRQGFPVAREFCQMTLHQLTSSNPAGAIEIQQP